MDLRAIAPGAATAGTREPQAPGKPARAESDRSFDAVVADQEKNAGRRAEDGSDGEKRAADRGSEAGSAKNAPAQERAKTARGETGAQPDAAKTEDAKSVAIRVDAETAGTPEIIEGADDAETVELLPTDPIDAPVAEETAKDEGADARAPIDAEATQAPVLGQPAAPAADPALAPNAGGEAPVAGQGAETGTAALDPTAELPSNQTSRVADAGDAAKPTALAALSPEAGARVIESQAAPVGDAAPFAAAAAATAEDDAAKAAPEGQTALRGASATAATKGEPTVRAASPMLAAPQADGALAEQSESTPEAEPAATTREPRLGLENQPAADRAAVAPAATAAAAPNVNAPTAQPAGLGAETLAAQAAGPASQPAPVEAASQAQGAERMAPATPAATAESARAAQPVIAALRGREGAQTIELRLDPPELGRVEIDISFDGDRVVVALRADREDALDLLRRHGQEFMRELRQSGLDVSDMSFERREQGEGRSDSQRAFSDSDARWNAARAIHADSPGVSDAAQALAAEGGLSIGRQGGLDLRV